MAKYSVTHGSLPPKSSKTDEALFSSPCFVTMASEVLPGSELHYLWREGNRQPVGLAIVAASSKPDYFVIQALHAHRAVAARALLESLCRRADSAEEAPPVWATVNKKFEPLFTSTGFRRAAGSGAGSKCVPCVLMVRDGQDGRDGQAVVPPLLLGQGGSAAAAAKEWVVQDLEARATAALREDAAVAAKFFGMEDERWRDARHESVWVLRRKSQAKVAALAWKWVLDADMTKPKLTVLHVRVREEAEPPGLTKFMQRLVAGLDDGAFITVPPDARPSVGGLGLHHVATYYNFIGQPLVLLGLRREGSAEGLLDGLVGPQAGSGALERVAMCQAYGCTKLGRVGTGLEVEPGAMKSCGQCRVALYCSRDCQREHWANGHRASCGELGQLRQNCSAVLERHAAAFRRMAAVLNDTDATVAQMLQDGVHGKLHRSFASVKKALADDEMAGAVLSASRGAQRKYSAARAECRQALHRLQERMGALKLAVEAQKT